MAEEGGAILSSSSDDDDDDDDRMVMTVGSPTSARGRDDSWSDDGSSS